MASKQPVKRPRRSPPRGPAANRRRRPPAQSAAQVPARARSRESAGDSRAPLIRAALAISLDGFIADKDGNVEWLDPYFTPEIDFAAFMRTIGATVYGRTTWDQAVARGYGGGYVGGPGRTIVLTHHGLEGAAAGGDRVEAFGGDVRGLAASLRTELTARKDTGASGRDIWLMGGGRSIAPFHEAGLVDRWELAIMPILLGEGIPLFPSGGRRALAGLRLTHSRVLNNGVVEVWYEPERKGAQR
jgi:dihydrofolate reductase